MTTTTRTLATALFVGLVAVAAIGFGGTLGATMDQPAPDNGNGAVKIPGGHGVQGPEVESFEEPDGGSVQGPEVESVQGPEVENERDV